MKVIAGNVRWLGVSYYQEKTELNIIPLVNVEEYYCVVKGHFHLLLDISNENEDDIQKTLLKVVGILCCYLNERQ